MKVWCCRRPRPGDKVTIWASNEVAEVDAPWVLFRVATVEPDPHERVPGWKMSGLMVKVAGHKFWDSPSYRGENRQYETTLQHNWVWDQRRMRVEREVKGEGAV